MRTHLPAAPLRILNVVRFPIGGIRSYLRYTYSQLDPDRYATTVLTIDIPEARLLPSGMAPLATELITVPVSTVPLRLATAAFNLVRRGRYALIHSQGTTAAAASALVARLYGVPHVVTLHETFRAEQFRGRRGELKRRVLGSLFSGVDAVITVSQDARDNLLAHIPISRRALDRVHVIRNGVAVDRVLQESADDTINLRSRWSIADDVKLLGFIGRFMPEKGFGVLVDAIQLLEPELPQLPRFVVVALNDGAFVREYKQRVRDLNLDHLFVFAGFHSSAARALVEFDGVVMPSLREACPLVAMEAMVLGCPLIASDCLGLREVTAESPALRAIAGDPSSLAAAIRELLLNANMAKRAAANYAETARCRFNSSLAAARLAEVIGDVMRDAAATR